MKTLKYILTFAVLLLMVSSVSAQNRQKMQRPDNGPMMEMPADLLESLNLSDDQKVKLFDLRQEHAKEAQKMREVMRSGDMSPNAARDARASIREKHDAQLKTILNDEQYAKIVAYRKQRQESNREMRDGRGNMRDGQRGGMMPNRNDRPRNGNRLK